MEYVENHAEGSDSTAEKLKPKPTHFDYNKKGDDWYETYDSHVAKYGKKQSPIDLKLVETDQQNKGKRRIMAAGYENFLNYQTSRKLENDFIGAHFNSTARFVIVNPD
jgi:carbonic anhydrase